MNLLLRFVILFGLLVSTAAFADPAANGPYGTLNPAAGGFPVDLWAHGDGRQIEKFLTLLPDTVLSPSTHELLRRALLTIAPAPSGLGEEEFLKARVTSLLKIGDAGDAGALLRTALPGADNVTLARQVVDGEFYAAQTESACLDVRSYAAKFADDYWKRALVVCELAAGQHDEANAGIATLSGGEDTNFVVLATAVAQGEQPHAAGGVPTAPDIALLRLGKAALPASLLHQDDVVVMAGIARTDTYSAATRVEAAYEAAVQGGFGINEMLALMRTPGAADPAGNQTIGRDDPTESMAQSAHRQSALVQAVDQTKDSPQKIQALTRMLTVDSDTVDVPFLSRLEFLRMQTVTAERSGLAPAAARGYFLEGDVPAAQRWYDIARKSADPAETDRLWPLAYIAFEQTGSTNGELEHWISKTIASDKDNGTKRAERVLAAVSALGQTIPANLWLEAVGKPDDEDSIMGSMAISAAMADAANIDARGEVIVLVALSLKDGPGHAHPLNLNHAVGALWHVGLQNQARAVALEGLAPATDLAAK